MYIIDGQAETGGYTLTLLIEGLYAFTGRAALAFDTEVLRLEGRDDLSAFRMASGTASVAEIRPESEMVSSEGGYACLAWYCTGRGIDARQSPREIAKLRFPFPQNIQIVFCGCHLFPSPSRWVCSSVRPIIKRIFAKVKRLFR